MEGGMGHTGGLTNRRPWRGRCRAGYSFKYQWASLALKEGAFNKKNTYCSSLWSPVIGLNPPTELGGKKLFLLGLMSSSLCCCFKWWL